jgi:hypothetical protein
MTTAHVSSVELSYNEPMLVPWVQLHASFLRAWLNCVVHACVSALALADSAPNVTAAAREPDGGHYRH